MEANQKKFLSRNLHFHFRRQTLEIFSNSIYIKLYSSHKIILKEIEVLLVN